MSAVDEMDDGLVVGDVEDGGGDEVLVGVMVGLGQLGQAAADAFLQVEGEFGQGGVLVGRFTEAPRSSAASLMEFSPLPRTSPMISRVPSSVRAAA